MKGTGADKGLFSRFHASRHEEHPWFFAELWAQVGGDFQEELGREGGEMVDFAGTRVPLSGRH